MKIGAENKKQLYWMIGLLAVAVPLAIYEFGGMLGTSAAAPAVPAASVPATQKSGGQIASAAPDTLDPTLRTDILDESRKTKYEAGGRNIFRMEEPPPLKVDAPVRTVAPTPTPIPTPTPPPPIPLKFYGFATNRPNEPKRVFLAEGDSIFVAKQGDIIDRRYRVVQIQNTSVTIEDVLFNHKQPIPLTAR